MTQQPGQTRASPAPEGMTTARRVMADAVAFYLANGSCAEARKHVDRLANELKFYDDLVEAYRDALAMINEAERRERREAELERQRQQRDMLLAIMGAVRPELKPTVKLPDENGNEPGRLPDQLATEKALRMWQKVQGAGYIDDHYQPERLSRTEAALLADEMAERLGIRNKWKTFEGLWNRRNMRSDYNGALDQRKTSDFRNRLKSLFSDL